MDSKSRLGYWKKGDEDDAVEIRAHPFFSDIDWNQIQNRTHRAPFVPRLKDDEDLRCIDELFTKENIQETFVDPSQMKSGLTKDQMKKTHFENFSY